MRRIAIGVLCALGLAGVAWTGAWWWAAQTMTARLDAELVTLAEAGVTVEAQGRQIGGFPLRLDLHQHDIVIASRSGFWTLRLEHAVSSASVLTPDRVRTLVGDSEMRRVGTLDLADRGVTMARLAVGARGMVIETPLAPAAPMATVAADALSLVEIGGLALREGSLDLEGMSARIDRHTVPTVADDGHRLAMQAARLELSVAPMAAVPQRTQMTAEAVRLDGTLAGLRGADLSSALAAPGQLVLGIEAADAVVQSVVYGTPAPGAAVDLDTLPVAQALRATGRIGQRLTVADGRIVLEATGTALLLDVAHPAIGGRFAAPEASGRFMMPLRDLPLPEPFALELRVTGVQPDGDTWAALDPRSRLDRGPLAFTVDIRGEARLLAGQPNGTRQPPVRVERIDIEALDFSGFGSTIGVTGSLSPVIGQTEPDGRLSMRLQGWSSLLRALETLGLLDPLQSMLVADVASALQDPDGDDALRADVELSRGGLVVNGRRYR